MGMQLSSSIHEENKYICRDCHHPAQLITCTPFCCRPELQHDCHLCSTGAALFPLRLQNPGLAALGGALEIYDFIIFVFFALTLSQLFFPPEMPDGCAAAKLRHLRHRLSGGRWAAS
jgi:hypothetical protein